MSSGDAWPVWLLLLGRRRHVVLLLAGVLPALWHVHTSGGIGDWAYFRTGALVLTGQGPYPPLHLYAQSPDTQIGPPALLLALPVALLPPTPSMWVIVVVLGATLPLVCHLLERAAVAERPTDPGTQLTVLAGGLFAAIYWWRLAADFTHPEDVLAVLAVALVLVWTRTRPDPRTAWIGAALLGTAAAGKPWAVGFLPLVAVWAGPVLVRAARVALGGLVAALWWTPFLVGAPGTLAALGTFRVQVWQSSPLALLGLAGSPYPEWVRPVQFGLALTLAVLAVVLGKVHLLPVAVLAARIAVDPQAWDYYFATVAAACLAVDLARTSYRGPWLTVGVVVVLYDARWLAGWQVSAALQTLPIVIVCGYLASGWTRLRELRRSLVRLHTQELSSP